ncbi:hypothetical protein ACFUMH_08460 [Cellulomonas sp. NPDC057328]|uniref:hypothetical protein n=1 Tax=Cellulomonas sp. NPDC057328 TaxID=3346101 RepID=UPI00363C3254
MPSVWVHCPEHGYQSAGIGIGEGASVEIVGSASSCPWCGRTLPITDGVYTVRSGLVGIVRQVRTWSPAQVTQARRAVERARREAKERGDIAAALQGLATTNRDLADAIQRTVTTPRDDRGTPWSRSEVLTLLTIVIALLAWLRPVSGGQPVEIPDEQQMAEVVERTLRERGIRLVSPSPRPSPSAAGAHPAPDPSSTTPPAQP